MGASSSSATQLTAFDVSELSVGVLQWLEGVAVGTKAIFAPCYADQLLVFDTETSSLSSLSTQRFGSGGMQWRAGTAVGSRAVFAPCDANMLIVYDATSHSLAGFDTSKWGSGRMKWFKGIAAGGKAIFAPCDADHVIVFDPASSSVAGIDTRRFATGARKWLGGASVAGKAIFAPYSADHVLIFDALSNSLSGLETRPFGSGQEKWAGGVAVGSKAVFAPHGAEQLIVYDAAFHNLSGLDTGCIHPPGGCVGRGDGRGAGPPSGAKKLFAPLCTHSSTPGPGAAAPGGEASRTGKWLGGVAVGGKAVFAPQFLDHLLVYDPLAGSVEGVDARALGVEGEKWIGGVAVGGTAVFAPCDGDQALLFDAASGSISGLSTAEFGTGFNKWLVGVGIGGKAIFAPSDAEQLLVYDSGLSTDHLSLRLNCRPSLVRLEELMAAALSSWIYTTELKDRGQEGGRLLVPELSTMDGECHIQIHQVTQSDTLGSQVKFATSTVTLGNFQKAFYITFKGTSYLMDVVNLNVGRSYSSTNDSASFLHMGAASVVRELLFLQEQGLFAELCSAYTEGARRLVLTGHSLGGMYAAALLHWFFQRRRTGGLPAGVQTLLESARCICFGSPMCFGVNAGAAPGPGFQEFQAYVAARAVNFIHESDPCPRLWSAVDGRAFMRSAADALKDGIIEEQGGIAGGIAGRVIDEAVEQVVNRSDFERLVNSVCDFRHFMRLVLLSSQRLPHCHWKEDFVLNKGCFQHHSMRMYVERLRDATDPLPGGGGSEPCYLYSEDGSPAGPRAS